MELSRTSIDKVLIVGITPYFLEKGSFWFEENFNNILRARKTEAFFKDNTLYLEKNQSFPLSQLLKKLDEMGYERVLNVSEPGELSHRGGIVDVFPINLKGAFRIEFFDNKIEEISELPIYVPDREKSKEILRKRLKLNKLFSDLKGLRPGDYVVHLDHGVARFRGIKKFQTLNYYVLEYAQDDKLYIPVGLERKLSRYIGFVKPKISRLGARLWQKTKKRVKQESEKFARELLAIYVQRKVAQRPRYEPDNEIDFKLAADFRHEETPDQMKAIEDIKADLQKEEPMDRLVCGDVGFGKTEIALRIMVKAVNSGYQSVLICPTTILAEQHFWNFQERLKNLPIRISLLSRLQTKQTQRKITEDLKNGKIDIIIGTHRLLSKDVAPRLFERSGGRGLLVIDDEQKFGVAQKEKLKRLRASLDILSLSATPIPRTLYMVLSSLKSVSLVQTPPEGRLPVKTFILPFGEKIIKEAIEKELQRGGQVYYLHNKIGTIGLAKKLISKLTPRSRIGLAHGRLKEKDLLGIMEDFRRKKIDILLATTIIENGLDLPRVNTLIVDNATRLGLAQAHQIRGRVGRSSTQSFAYFLHPRKLSPLAKQRLNALMETEKPGSGYYIALRDLEIRGAGNILGKEQSGNINSIGLNLYCQMLSEAIDKIKKE